MFEAVVLVLAKAMPIAEAARMLGEHDTRLWRVVQHYVEGALESRDLLEVRSVGVDETASKRGHQYITLFVDLEQSVDQVRREEQKSRPELKGTRYLCIKNPLSLSSSADRSG